MYVFFAWFGWAVLMLTNPVRGLKLLRRMEQQQYEDAEREPTPTH